MARIEKVEVASATGPVREIFDLYQRERGNVPNMFRTVAHRPELLRTMIAHFRAVMAPDAVDLRLKELVVVAVSGINGCDYCLNSHTKLLAKAGASEEEIVAARDGRYEGFSPRERIALEYAATLTRDPRGVTDQLYARLSEHFDAGQIIEISAVTGLFNYFNRFNNALEMEPTT
ncbi:MAG: carboxymuconolactone decarboxylase family protein [Candidatus Eisenbacteria bacterium]